MDKSTQKRMRKVEKKMRRADKRMQRRMRRAEKRTIRAQEKFKKEQRKLERLKRKAGNRVNRLAALSTRNADHFFLISRDLFMSTFTWSSRIFESAGISFRAYTL